MGLKTSVRGVMLVAGLALSLGVSADGYNEGFVAAESGKFKEAVTHWQPLADKGHAIAQFNLAMMYHGGLGVELNEKVAMQWYHKSAENGYYKAQEYLAVGYREGWFGLPKDLKKAEYWENRIEQGE